MTDVALRRSLVRLNLFLVLVACVFCSSLAAATSGIERFVGSFSGSAELTRMDGTTMPRDMSVVIAETRRGFSVKWSTITYHPEDGTREKSYDISFVASDRPDVFAAAMKKNVFGHEVQLDPMKGEPYVWARITGDTLTVFSLFVDADGDYELQQFDRTLTEGGLNLDFTRIANGEEKRTVSAFLKKQN